MPGRIRVAPIVGAWIEITNPVGLRSLLKVAPIVGAWIEISLMENHLIENASLLSWERGLK